MTVNLHQACTRQLPHRTNARRLPACLWIKKHIRLVGFLAVIVFPIGLLGALLVCTLGLTLPIAFIMGLL